jgi:type I restriction enzyme S subunit
VIEKKKQQLKELDVLAQSIFYEMFGNPDESQFPVLSLSSLSKSKLSYGSGASAIEYDNKIRYIRITDIMEDGKLDKNAVSPSVYDDKYVLNDGDILFARSGATVGKTYLYRKIDGFAIYAGYLIRFIPDTDKVIPEYVYYYTRSSYYLAFVKKNAQAVAQPNINAKQYGDLQVAVPPLSLQQQFASKIESIDKQKELIRKSIEEVEMLFNSRMDYYFG